MVPVHPVSPGLTTHIKPYPGLKSVSNLIYRFKTSIQTTPCLRECLMPVCKNHFEKKKTLDTWLPTKDETSETTAWFQIAFGKLAYMKCLKEENNL